MTDAQKKWIDNASYQQLLSRWRHAPIGDPMFQGETGEYYKKVLSKKRSENNERHVHASKQIGR